MLVTCPRCLTKYSLSEESLVSRDDVRLRCSRCGWDFFLEQAEVFSETIDEVDAAAPGASAGRETEGGSPAASEDAVATEESEKPDAFELADDYSESADDGLEAGPAGKTGPGETENAAAVDEGSEESADLALDLSDLDLDDIEFDDFDDEEVQETVGDASETETSSTRIDDNGLEALLNEDKPATEPDAAASEPSAVAGARQAEPVTVSLDTARTASGGGRGKAFLVLLSCFLVFSLALWTAYALWRNFSVDMAKLLRLAEIENQRLILPSGRRIVIIRGKVVNDSPNLVSDLKIKGYLLDGQGKHLVEAVTAGGVSFSEEELDRLDAGKLAMLENPKVTVAAGGELPFMLAFYDYPDGARECYVEIASFKVKKTRRRLGK